MKNYIILILSILVIFGLHSCKKYEVEDPSVSDWIITEVTTNDEGENISTDSVLTSAPVGMDLWFEVTTDADICTIWPGDKGWLAWGPTDSIMESRQYADYGQLGARGVEMSVTTDKTGFRVIWDYEYYGDDLPVTAVVTNHGVDGPDYKQVVVELGTFDVTP